MHSSSLLSKVFFFLLILLSLSGYINSPVALTLGIGFALVFKHPYAHLSQRAVNWLLKIAVVGLGFAMHMDEAITAGKDGFLLTLFSIALTLSLGFTLGKFFKLDKKLAHLLSYGTTI